MNNDLNMQLVEQLTAAKHGDMSPLDTICQPIHDILDSQLTSYKGISVYQQQGDDHTVVSQFPKDNTSKQQTDLPTIDDQHHKIVGSDIFLPIQTNGLYSSVVHIIIQDTKEQTQINWQVLHQLIQNISHAAKTSEASLMETQLQYAISSDLVKSTTLTDMLQILLRYFGEDANGASIVEVEYDTHNVVQDAFIRHQIKSDIVNDVNISIANIVPLNDLHDLHNALTSTDTLIYFIENTETQSEIPTKVFIEQGIKSCIFIPLSKNQRLQHLISINWASPRTFPEHSRQLLDSVCNQLSIIYLNQQLLEEAQLTADRLSKQVKIHRHLNELATFASTNRDEQLLLDKGAVTLKEVLNVDHIGIMMIDEDGQTAYLATEHPAQSNAEVRIPVEGEVWEKLKRGEHHLIKSVDGDALSEDVQSAMKSVNISSSIFIPFLDLSGHLFGSVGLDKFDGEIQLSDEQIQTAQLLNSQLITQIENIRLLRDSQQLADQMQQIAQFSETVQSRLELKEILQTTLHFTKRIIAADYIGVALYDNTLNKLIVRAYFMDGDESILPADVTEMSSDTLVESVWKVREPIVISDMSDTNYTHPLTSKVVSAYAVNLTSRSVTHGVIEVGYTSRHIISQTEQSVIQQLANQLAVALENSNTNNQSQRLTQNKILANEISLQLQQQIDIDSLLNTTVTELGKALGAKRARIRLGVQQTLENQ